MRAKSRAKSAATIHPIWFLGALSLVALLPFKAHADAAGEIVTANQHADLAGQATDIGTVHAHLQHTVNCLVGPGGTGFDSKALNPCANAGKGAIPDTADAGKKKTLEDAVKSATAGIAEPDLAKAKAAATATAATLKSAQ